METLCTCHPCISDRTAHAGLVINYQFDARADPPPSKRRAGYLLPLSGAEYTSQVPKPLGAALRHEKGDLAEASFSRNLSMRPPGRSALDAEWALYMVHE